MAGKSARDLNKPPMMSAATRAKFARLAYDAPTVVRRAALVSVTLMAIGYFLEPASDAGDPLQRGLFFVVIAGIALSSTLALSLAIAVARPADALEPQWSASVAWFGWAVAFAFVVGRLTRVPGWHLGIAALGYAMFVAVVALSALASPRAWVPVGRTGGSLTLPVVVLRTALMLWLVGAIGFVIDGFGLTPVGFPPVIVRLFAVHFHFASFILPVIAAALAAAYPSRLTRTAAVVTVLGAPSTAIGITAVQLGAPRWIEALFTAPMILGAILVAVVHLALAIGAWEAAPTLPVRALRLVVGLTLLGTMGLAAAFVARGWLPWAPTIPQMAMWHGIGNTVGVALCGLLACWFDAATRPPVEAVAR